MLLCPMGIMANSMVSIMMHIRACCHRLAAMLQDRGLQQGWQRDPA